MRSRNARLTSLAVVACLAVLQAQEPGKATGTLTVGSSKLVLSHAYAFPQKGHDDPAKEDYLVFVTDQPFPASALTDEFEREELLLERKIQGLEIVVTADKRVVKKHLYHPGLGATGLSTTAGEFEGAALDAQRVAGKVFMARPDDFSGKSIHYEATFSAPIVRKRPLTKADLESPPARAAGAFLKAAAAADVRALRAVVTAAGVKELDGPQGKEILEMLPVAISARMTITSLEVTGDTATVFAEGTDKGATNKIKLTLVRENQQWKVTQPVKP